MTRTGFIGLGGMGRAMAANVLAAGWPVAVFNRTPGREQGLPREHLRVAGSPADAARDAEIVVSMLADDAAVEAATFGPNGLLSGLAEDAVHVCMSTISIACSRRLAAAHAERGRGYLAAPVFGRPEAAAAAKLWIVAGGRASLVERCRPLFERLGQGVFHVGEEPEKANLVKLAGNFTIAATLEALAEAFALVRKSGIEPRQFLEIINGALFKSPLYETYGSLQVDERFEPAGFKLRLGLKDLSLVLAAAAAAEVPMPVGNVIHSHMLSGMAQGMGDIDWSGLARIVARNAGLGEKR